MATAGISRSGRPEAAPAGLAAAKAKSDLSPGRAKWTKGDPQEGALGALGIRGIPSLCQSEGTRGRRRSAERCPRGSSAPGAADERSAAQRAPFPAAAAQPIAQTRRIQPTPLCRCCWNPGGVLGGFGHYAGVEITRTVLSPRPPARATRVLPSKLVAAPDLGVGGGEGERLAPPPPFSSRGRCSSCCQMNPRMGTCNPPPHPQPHTSRSENWEGGAGSKVLEKQELTCKQAVLLSSGLLDHDVDILLNSLLP